MSQKESQLDELIPIELKLRLLRAELDQLESDSRWIAQRRQEVLEEVGYYDELLDHTRRRALLRRVK